MLVTVKDFFAALKKIKENPQDHGLSDEEYESVIAIQRELKEWKKFFDPVDRMRGYSFEHLFKPGCRFDAMHFASAQ